MVLGSVDGAGRAAHVALKSGNFGGPAFFRKAFAMLEPKTLTAALREQICRQEPVLSRVRPRHGRQHQRAARDGDSLITPTDACLGSLDPARLAQVDAQACRDPRRPCLEDASADARIYAAGASLTPIRGRCVIHTHSTHLVAAHPGAASGARRVPSTHHALLRDEGRPRAADCLPPPGDPRRRLTVVQAIESYATAARRSARSCWSV